MCHEIRGKVLIVLLMFCFVSCVLYCFDSVFVCFTFYFFLNIYHTNKVQSRFYKLNFSPKISFSELTSNDNLIPSIAISFE